MWQGLCTLPGQLCCFSLLQVTVPTLCCLVLSLSLSPVWMSLGFSIVGVCISLKGILLLFFSSCPLFMTPSGCLVEENPARDLTFPVRPLTPDGKFTFPSGSGKCSKWVLMSGWQLVPHHKAADTSQGQPTILWEWASWSCHFLNFQEKLQTWNLMKKNFHYLNVGS